MSIPIQSHMLALLQTNMITIDVVYPKGADDYDGGKRYTYMCNSTWAHDMKKAMDAKEVVFVIVPSTDYGYKVARVANVHTEPQIDQDAPYKYKWIISPIDTAWYDGQLHRDQEGFDMLRAANKAKAVTELITAMGLNGTSGIVNKIKLLLGGGQPEEVVEEEEGK